MAARHLGLRLRIGLLLVATLAAGAPAAVLAGDPQTGLVDRLPFDLGPRGHILIPVRVNGGAPATFALDTGAGSNVVNARYARELGDALPRRGDVEINGAHATSTGAMTRLDTLTVGAITTRKTPALIMDISHVEGPDMRLDGLIGVPFLEHYDVLVDFGTTTVSLYEPGSLATLSRERAHTTSPIGAGVGPAAHGNLIFVNVSFQDQGLTAVLDTGSGRSGINSPAAAALGIELPEGMADDHDSPTIHRPRAALPGMEIAVGDGRLQSSAPVAIVDLPVFAALGLDDRPAMLLGTNFLAGREIGIDYATRQLYLFD